MNIHRMTCSNPKCTDDKGKRTRLYIYSQSSLLNDLPRMARCGGCEEKEENGKAKS